MLHLSLIWAKDGTPQGVIVQDDPQLGLDKLRSFALKVQEQWLSRMRIPVYYRLSKKTFEELAHYSTNPSAMHILQQELAPLTLLTPPFEQLPSDCPQVLDTLNQSHIKFALGQLLVRKEHVSLLPFVQTCELHLPDLGRDVCTNLHLKLTQHQCFISGVKNMPEVADLSRLEAKLFTGKAVFERSFAAKTVRLDASTLKALRLLQMVYQEAELSEIEIEIKEDPALAYKLLSLINSAGLRTQRTIGTIKDALMVLGYKPLGLWLSLLLLNSTQKKNPNRSLHIYTLLRAKLASMIMQRYNPDAMDEAFICSLFSCLDAYLDAPLQELISKAQLPSHMKDAILMGKGQLGQSIKLAQVHHQDSQTILAMLQEYDIPPEEYSLLLQDAWMYTLTLHPLH